MELQNIIREDIRRIGDTLPAVEKLTNKTVLITGTTGLLGSVLVRTIHSISQAKDLHVTIVAMSRSNERTRAALEGMDTEGIIFLEQDITEPVAYEGSVDYIIHTACPTKSKFFVEHAVETVDAIVGGTKSMLELAKNKKSASIVYLSSMEVYAQVLHENLLSPEDVGYMNPLSLRSSYPEGKRLAENYCMGYASEYQVPVKVVRLAQTFGPGIPKEDNRVFAQFLHSVLARQDIVMFTEGGSKRMYLDTMDAVSALLYVLLNGENGKVYNAGNDITYCSIREMAELVIREFGDGSSKLVIDRSKDVGQYPPDNMLRLDVAPLKALGWEAKYSLVDLYRRMAQGMEE